MWTFFGFGQSKVTCWCCNEATRLPRSEADKDTVRNWHCHNCDTQNTIDDNGEIVDSHKEMYRTVSESDQRKLRVLSGLESASSSFPKVRFCETCQDNQQKVYDLLSAYLPSEDSPDYTKRLGGLEDYSQNLHRMYPIACSQCLAKVDERLQTQASWLQKRSLGSALRQSERELKNDSHITAKPSLRLKIYAVGWVLSALLGLLACPVATMGLYADSYYRHLQWELVPVCAAVVSVTTWLSGDLNPLWLSEAFSSNVRAAGLPGYKRRMRWLSVARPVMLAAAYARRPQPLTIVFVCVTDLVMMAYSFHALRIISKLRPGTLSRQASSSGEAKSKGADVADDGKPPAEHAHETSEAISSMGGLSLGVSDANRDQDDSFPSAEFGHWYENQPSHSRSRHHRSRPDSASDDAVDDELAAAFSLGSLSAGGRSQTAFAPPMAAESMDVDSPGSLFGSSPDQQLATHHNNYRLFESSSLQGRNTGLEMKMQGFSLRDDDEDVDMEPAAATSSNRRFLVPDSTREMAGKGGELMWTNPLTIGRRVVFVASVLLLLLCLAKGPHHAPAWGARVLFVLSLAKPPGQQPTRAARFWWHRVLLLLLSAALLMLPAVYTALSIKSMPLGSMTGALLRWPHAKSFVIRAIEYAVLGSDTPLELAVPNANDQMLRRVMAGDFVAEFAALVYFCVWP